MCVTGEKGTVVVFIGVQDLTFKSTKFLNKFLNNYYNSRHMINNFPPKVVEKQGDIFNSTVSKDLIPGKFTVKYHHYHVCVAKFQDQPQ